MYALDHSDIALGPMAESGRQPGWLDGVYDQAPDGVSPRIITNSPTWRYVNSLDAFRCMADKSRLRYQGRLQPRVISFAANAFMGPASSWVSPLLTRYKNVRKLGDLTGPGPTDIYILLDEHENSINDAHYFPFDNLSAYRNNKWLDAPSGRHNNAGGFAFADGHSEIHKFRTPGLKKTLKSADGSTPRPYPDLPFIGASEPIDYVWMTNHIAPLKN
jgi:prepilin-type processing-associated H-X9-DG protein